MTYTAFREHLRASCISNDYKDSVFRAEVPNDFVVRWEIRNIEVSAQKSLQIELNHAVELRSQFEIEVCLL